MAMKVGYDDWIVMWSKTPCEQKQFINVTMTMIKNITTSKLWSRISWQQVKSRRTRKSSKELVIFMHSLLILVLFLNPIEITV